MRPEIFSLEVTGVVCAAAGWSLYQGLGRVVIHETRLRIGFQFGKECKGSGVLVVECTWLEWQQISRASPTFLQVAPRAL